MCPRCSFIALFVSLVWEPGVPPPDGVNWAAWVPGVGPPLPPEQGDHDNDDDDDDDDMEWREGDQGDTEAQCDQ